MNIAIIHPWLLGITDFGPEYEKNGVAGAEETLINISREMARLGIQVTVFTHVAKEVRAQGVLWKHIDELSRDEHYDVIWSWSDNIKLVRSLIKNFPKTRLKLFRFVNQQPERDVEELMSIFDKCIGQTYWLNSRYMCLNKGNSLVIPNGIKAENFTASPVKNRNQFVYASDYDRGLIHLLDIWKIIKSIHNDAILKICYGWNIYETKMNNLRKQGNEDAYNQMKEYKKRLEIGMKQEGIIHLGKIGHQQVDELLMESQYWSYPCTFPENCSTLSLKAQAASTIPIIIKSGGLKETVKYSLSPSQEIWQRGKRDEQIVINSAVKDWKKILVRNIISENQDITKQTQLNASRVREENAYPTIARRILDYIKEALE